MSPKIKTVRVVGALCVLGERVLLTQRPLSGTHGGRWEFPGGKVEVGESEPEALRRELMEELGLHVQVGRLTHRVDHREVGFEIHLGIYRCEALSAVTLVEAADARWLLPEELVSYTVTPADAPVIDDLITHGIPRGVGRDGSGPLPGVG